MAKHVADRNDYTELRVHQPVIYMPINNQPISGQTLGVKRAN